MSVIPGEVTVRFKTIAQRWRAREWASLAVMLAGLALAGCSSMSRMGDLLSDNKPADAAVAAPSQPGLATPPAALPALPSAPGRRIALLLPLSAAGDARSLASNMEKSARLALAEGGSADIIVKDTGGTADQARAAAEDALNEGAGIILGPVGLAEVQAAAGAAQARGVNVVSFASQPAAAGANSFIMGFSPDAEVRAVLRHAAAQGKTPAALLHPQSAYGEAVAASFAHAGGTGLVRSYARVPTAVAAPATAMAKVVKTPAGQALLLPDGGQMLRSVSLALIKSGVDPKKVKILGTSLWDDALTRATPIAQGGWFATVSPDRVAGFFQTFEAAHKYRPQRSASLAYDAVKLALQLQARGDFSAAAIGSAQGFVGSNGAYRFRADGTVERQLAIMEMTPAGPRVIAPARSSF